MSEKEIKIAILTEVKEKFTERKLDLEMAYSSSGHPAILNKISQLEEDIVILDFEIESLKHQK